MDQNKSPTCYYQALVHLGLMFVYILKSVYFGFPTERFLKYYEQLTQANGHCPGSECGKKRDFTKSVLYCSILLLRTVKYILIGFLILNESLMAKLK